MMCQRIGRPPISTIGFGWRRSLRTAAYRGRRPGSRPSRVHLLSHSVGEADAEMRGTRRLDSDRPAPMGAPCWPPNAPARPSQASTEVAGCWSPATAASRDRGCAAGSVCSTPTSAASASPPPPCPASTARRGWPTSSRNGGETSATQRASGGPCGGRSRRWCSTSPPGPSCCAPSRCRPRRSMSTQWAPFACSRPPPRPLRCGAWSS